MRVGVGELSKDKVDKGMVPISCSSGSILEWGAKTKGNKSASLEEAGMKLKVGLGEWG